MHNDTIGSACRQYRITLVRAIFRIISVAR